MLMRASSLEPRFGLLRLRAVPPLNDAAHELRGMVRRISLKTLPAAAVMCSGWPNIQYVLREIPDAPKRLGPHARGLVDRRSCLARDESALDRTPAPRGPIGGVSVPDRAIEDDYRPCRAACEYLVAGGTGLVFQFVGLV